MCMKGRIKMGKKRRIISLAGELGSGKTTVSNMLMEILNYPIHRNGEYFRKLAVKMGMSVTEFNEYVKEHPEIDNEIEESAREAARENDELIIDARLGWYAVPESFKVYLKVDIDEAARRAYNDPKRKESERFATVQEQKEDMERRFQLENERYFEVYGIHKEDESNYDFVLDTTHLSKEEVVESIIDAYNAWLKKED